MTRPIERLVDHSGLVWRHPAGARWVCAAQVSGVCSPPAGARAATAGLGGEGRRNGLDAPASRQVLGALGTLGNDADVLSRACDHYARYKEDPASVDADVIAACVSAIAVSGDRTDFDDSGSSSRQPVRHRKSAASSSRWRPFESSRWLRRRLGTALDGQVRTQDAPFLVAGTFFNPDFAELAWGFTREHWDEMRRKYPDNAMMRIVEGVTALNTATLADEAEAFFRAHEVPGAGKRLDQALERQRINVDFRTREAENAAAYFNR